MENKCAACGFVNPEGAGFCSLCGVPFIGPTRGPAPSVVRAPSRVKGESREMDAATLGQQLDEDSSTRPQEDLLRELARLVPEGKDAEDDLDRLLSDYDGSMVQAARAAQAAAAAPAKAPQGAPPVPARPAQAAQPAPAKPTQPAQTGPARPAQALPAKPAQALPPKPAPSVPPAAAPQPPARPAGSGAHHMPLRKQGTVARPEVPPPGTGRKEPGK